MREGIKGVSWGHLGCEATACGPWPPRPGTQCPVGPCLRKRREDLRWGGLRVHTGEPGGPGGGLPPTLWAWTLPQSPL